MILVIGATGNTGSQVCQELSAQGIAYRALTRNAGAARGKLPADAEIVEADLGNTDQVRDALQGITGVYLATPPNAEMVNWQIGVIDAAKQAGVSKVVKLSGLGASPDAGPRLPRLHAEIEEHLRTSGLDYCILQPNLFMQNLLGHGGSVKSDGLIYAPAADGQISFTDIGDIARTAVRCLGDDNLKQEVIAVTGPSAESFHSVAEELSQLTGKRVQYRPVSFSEARASMVDAGYGEWLSDALIELFELYADNQGSYVSEDYKKVMGHQPTQVNEFLKQNQSAFMS